MASSSALVYRSIDSYCALHITDEGLEDPLFLRKACTPFTAVTLFPGCQARSTRRPSLEPGPSCNISAPCS